MTLYTNEMRQYRSVTFFAPLSYRLGSLEGRREKGDHFTLDVVTNSQEAEYGLKYVILIPSVRIEQ